MGKIQKEYRAINFDLISSELRKMFGEKGRTKAYGELGKFFSNENFTHRQWSGYSSKDKLSDAQIIKLNQKLFKTFPWLEYCARSIDVTIIREQYDLIQLNRLTSKNNKLLQETSTDILKENNPKTMSLSDLKLCIIEIKDNNKTKSVTINKGDKNKDQKER